MRRTVDLATRHQLFSYFALTYAFSWTLWLFVQPTYLRGHVTAAPFLMLGIFAPALTGTFLVKIIHPGRKKGDHDTATRAAYVLWMAALLLFAADQVSKEGRTVSLGLFFTSAAAAALPASVLMASLYSAPAVRDHLRTLVKPRSHPGWYLLALLLFPAIWGGGLLLTRALGLPLPAPKTSVAEGAAVVAVLLDFLYSLVYTGLAEEPGWRGFALPRLQARFSPLISSLILGVLWAVWHAPARFGGFESRSAEDTFVEWVFIVVIAILFTWLYNQTHFSLLSTVLLHPAMNVTSHFLPLSTGAIALLCAFVIFAVAQDRMWRRVAPIDPGLAASRHRGEEYVPSSATATTGRDEPLAVNEMRPMSR